MPPSTRFWRRGGGGQSKFLPECIIPNLAHVIPILDNTIFYWMRDVKEGSLGNDFIPHIMLLPTLCLGTTIHGRLGGTKDGTTDDGGEGGGGKVLSSKANFDVTGAIIEDKYL